MSKGNIVLYQKVNPHTDMRGPHGPQNTPTIIIGSSVNVVWGPNGPQNAVIGLNMDTF